MSEYKIRTKELKSGMLIILNIQKDEKLINQLGMCGQTLSEGQILSRRDLIMNIRNMNPQRHDEKIEQWTV